MTSPYIEFRSRLHSLLLAIESNIVNKLGISELKPYLSRIENHLSFQNYFNYVSVVASYRVKFMMNEDVHDDFVSYFMMHADNELKLVFENIMKYKYTITGGEKLIRNIFYDLELWLTDAMYKEVNQVIGKLAGTMCINVRIAGKQEVSVSEVEDGRLLFLWGPLFNRHTWSTFRWIDFIQRLFFVVVPDKHNVYLMGKQNYDPEIVAKSDSHGANNILPTLEKIYNFVIALLQNDEEK